MVLRNFLLISVALAVSATTAIFTKNWLATERAGMAAQVELEAAAPAISTGMVLVATREAPAGTFLKPEDLEWVAWPDPDGAVGRVHPAELVCCATRPRDPAGD